MKSNWSAWPLKTVSEIAASDNSAIAIGPFGSRMKADCYVADGIPVIRGMNINYGRGFEGDFVYISESKADELASSNVFPDDLVFPHRGAIGEVGIVPTTPYKRWVLSTSLMKLTCDTSKVDPSFLYYFFRSKWGRHELLKNASTVGTPGIARPLSSLKAILVPVPPLSEQQHIASILGVLDDKIELNRQMNRTLEAMGEAIFKSLFVDFDGYTEFEESRTELGEIPKDWSVKSLDEIAHFLNGTACQKYRPVDGHETLPVIKIREMRNGLSENTDRVNMTIPAKYIIDNGDVLFSWSGSLLVKIWSGGRGALNQHVFKVTSERYPKWFYYLWSKHHLDEFQRIAASKATTMGHIKRRHLSEALVTVPPDDELDRMNQTMEPLLQRQLSNDLQSRTLVELRNTLLPKLISGEIRVPEAEDDVEDAL